MPGAARRTGLEGEQVDSSSNHLPATSASARVACMAKRTLRVMRCAPFVRPCGRDCARARRSPRHRGATAKGTGRNRSTAPPAHPADVVRSGELRRQAAAGNRQRDPKRGCARALHAARRGREPGDVLRQRWTVGSHAFRGVVEVDSSACMLASCGDVAQAECRVVRIFAWEKCNIAPPRCAPRSPAARLTVAGSAHYRPSTTQGQALGAMPTS